MFLRTTASLDFDGYHNSNGHNFWLVWAMNTILTQIQLTWLCTWLINFVRSVEKWESANIIQMYLLQILKGILSNDTM